MYRLDTIIKADELVFSSEIRSLHSRGEGLPLDESRYLTAGDMPKRKGTI